jgi:hypothetical protein
MWSGRGRRFCRLPAGVRDQRLQGDSGVLTRTPLAIAGQPAKRPTARRTREKTSAVEGRREARTIEAERAEVRESDDVRLYRRRSTRSEQYAEIEPLFFRQRLLPADA